MEFLGNLFVVRCIFYVALKKIPPSWTTVLLLLFLSVCLPAEEIAFSLFNGDFKILLRRSLCVDLTEL